ncbi:MAG: zinc ribbon domain-containing protein [Fuerstiella sp.]|nr:zinc ribbon domain-containing protein [Fuerstiella sp.]
MGWNPFLFDCGCCGDRMTGAPKTNTRQKDAYRYVCATYIKSGHRDKHAGGCFYCHVDGEKLERSVLDRIQKTLLSEKNLQKVETALRKKLKARLQKQPDTKPLERKLARLNADIDKAADRLLRADDDLMDILSPRLREMRQDRDRVASELNSQKRQNNGADVDRIVSESLSWLNEVNDVIRQGTPQERRDVLLSLVDTITVEFEQEQRGSRTFSKITGAVIEYNKRIRDDKI